MRTSNMTVGAAGFVWLLSSSLLAQSWTLPQGTAVKDKGPRTYRFIVDHTVADTTGQVVQRQRVSGDYTRGLPGGEAVVVARHGRGVQRAGRDLGSGPEA